MLKFLMSVNQFCHKRLRLNVALATARSVSEANKSPLNPT
ncbi:hypothetical protein X875_17330 [Mannheimia varigena USDA-ARS-USMARC-1388]|nr:hypothetical protein X875_17330 [Mannheimia varigena USDA-ARS-USMARC-1388]